MKIWIDESFILKPKTGIGMYALTLEEALKQLQINYETFEFSLPKSLKFKFVFHILWLNTIFYIKTLIQKPDIIINSQYFLQIKYQNILRYRSYRGKKMKLPI